MKKIFSAVWDYFRRLDKFMLLICLVLSAFSVLLLYTLNMNEISAYVSDRQWKTQLAASCVGAVAALVISAIDYRFIAKLWWLYAPVSLILVCLLFTPLGVGVDDIGWLNLGFIQFQPSEMLKIAFIMTFSLHLSKVGDKLNDIWNMVLLAIHGLVPVALIMLQGDDGSALVFLFMFMEIYAGGRNRCSCGGIRGVELPYAAPSAEAFSGAV